MSMRASAIAVPEKSFLVATIVELARWRGWRCYHTFDSRRSESGFPDLCMVRRGRLLFSELKTERGKLTEEQKLWLKELRQFPGVEVHVWKPADWDEITMILK